VRFPIGNPSETLDSRSAAAQTLLHCNIERQPMNHPWGLDDLLADLRHARKRDDLGRLAFVAYCDVRRWAREAGRQGLAEQAASLVTQSPHQSRESFLAQIDQLMGDLEALQHAESAKGRRNGSSGWASLPADA
jgi:hypothetical protein